MIKYLLILFVTMIFLVQAAHSQSSLKGYVYSDTTSLKGVKNCQIVLYKDGKKVSKIKTDKNGFFQFRKLIALEEATLIFKKKDHSSLTITNIDSKKKEFSVEILLRRDYTIHDDLYQGSSKLYRITPDS